MARKAVAGIWSSDNLCKMKLFKKEEIVKREEFEQYILNTLDFHLKRLKPSIRKKIMVVVQTDTILLKKDRSKQINAFCITQVKPALIVIYIPNLINAFKAIINDNITNLLKHELSHILLDIKDEEETSKKAREIKVFKDE